MKFRTGVAGAVMVAGAVLFAPPGAALGEFAPQDDAVTTPMNEPVVVDVIANDGIPAGFFVDSLDVIDLPVAGFASVEYDVSVDRDVVVYEPDLDFEGADVFTYEVCVVDDQLEFEVECGEATVEVIVGGEDVPTTTTTAPRSSSTTTAPSAATTTTTVAAATASTRPSAATTVAPLGTSGELPRTGGRRGTAGLGIAVVLAGLACLALSRERRVPNPVRCRTAGRRS